MAPRKKPANSKVTPATNDSYTELERYCIWLNEYYKSLRRSGFNRDDAFWLITEKDSFPDWISFKSPTDLLEEEDDE